MVFTKRPSAEYKFTITFSTAVTPNRRVETPFVGFGNMVGVSCKPDCVIGVSVAIREPVAALHDASVGLVPVISIQSILANSEATVVSNLILFAPATNVTGICAVVVQVVQAAVFGNATLPFTSTPF